MKKGTITIVALSLPLIFSAAVKSEESADWEQVSAGINLGTLGGLIRERAYDSDPGGRKLSQLDWQYRNAAIVQGSLEWDAISWLSLGASGWTTLARKGGLSDNYDWLLDSQKTWTHHSTHPNTRLTFANQWDLHLTGWIVNEPTWRLGLLAGYQQGRFSFNAHGGSFNYGNGACTGVFPDIKIGGYKQQYDVPYIGLTGLYRYQNFEVGSSFKYSGWARAEATDVHYLHGLIFTDKTRNQDFFALSANLGYYLTKNMKVYLEGTWNRTTNKKANTTVTFDDNGTPGRVSFKDGAGIESYSFLTTAGLKYSF